jgi:exopolysaccharide biosynthesis polyprenyl glycosylphosphotransferase
VVAPAPPATAKGVDAMMILDHNLREKIDVRRNYYLQKYHKKKILLIGNSKETHDIAENLIKMQADYFVVGCMRTNSRDPVPVITEPTVHIFGDLSEMEIFLALIPLKVHVIIIADPEIRHHQVLKVLELARKYGVEIWTIPQLANAFIGDLRFFNFYGHPVIKIRNNTVSQWRLALKTLFDYTVAIFGIILTSPLMVLAAILILLTSPGPIFYLQERVGKNGRLFRVIKFRSMRVDAERDSGPILSDFNDHRITPVGKILRKAHIDELPQFFNVLNGTMSMVGPRPERPTFVETYSRFIPFFNDRFSIKPGITGMGQIYGGYHSKAEEKLIFDLNYIHNFNLWIDFKICARTAWDALESFFKRA